MILYLRRGQSTVSRNNSQVLGLMVDVRGCGWLWKLRELCWMAGIGMDYFRALVIDEEDSPDIFPWLSRECAGERGHAWRYRERRCGDLWYHILVFTVGGLVWDNEVVECTSPIFYTQSLSSKQILLLYSFPSRYLFPYINGYPNFVCYNVVNRIGTFTVQALNPRSVWIRPYTVFDRMEIRHQMATEVDNERFRSILLAC